MLIDNWFEKGFTLDKREGNKFFLCCNKGHAFSIWKARLNNVYCPVCLRESKKEAFLLKRKEAFKKNGWAKVDFIKEEDKELANVTCHRNHTTTRTLYKTDSCFICKQEDDFNKEAEVMKTLAKQYGLTVINFKRRTPRNTSSIVVKCDKGHKRSYIFSQFRFLEVICSTCQLLEEREFNRKLELERIAAKVPQIIKKDKQIENVTNKIEKSHQKLLKEKHLQDDLAVVGNEILEIPLKDYNLFPTLYTCEHKNFIKKYEWLGTVGNQPKWTFEARCKGNLAGIILLNEPVAYSSILRDQIPSEVECLIQRGATASWTAKNLGSKLISFAIKWMLRNTSKRVFIGYADPLAGEIGTIYQALGFDFLGQSYGSTYLLKHESVKKGKPFSPQSLYRTSAFKKWAKSNNIELKPEWFKDNGYKNLLAIPEVIKLSWRKDIKNFESQCEKVKIPPKGKYVLVDSLNKKEKASLNKLKTYTPQPYPKR